jgi:hypothetical protein
MKTEWTSVNSDSVDDESSVEQNDGFLVRLDGVCAELQGMIDEGADLLEKKHYEYIKLFQLHLI